MTKSAILRGLAVSVLVCRNPDSLESTSLDLVDVDLEGLRGDKHAGFTRGADGRTPRYPRGTRIRNDRQVSLVSLEELAQVATALQVPVVRPEWLGANVLLADIPGFSHLPPNTTLRFAGGVVLIVQRDNRPCKGPGRLLANHYGRPDLESGFPAKAIGLRGVVACVEHAGRLHAGEEVEVHLP
jgi:hypothetical protein